MLIVQNDRPLDKKYKPTLFCSTRNPEKATDNVYQVVIITEILHGPVIIPCLSSALILGATS